MLRVTIEFLPAGQEGKRSTLAVIDIANVSGMRPVSDYSVETREPLYGGGEKRRQVLVRRHKRDSGYWPLIAKVMRRLVSA